MNNKWKISVSKIKMAGHCPRQYIIAELDKKRVHSSQKRGISIGLTVHWIMEKFAKKACSSDKFIDLIIKEGVKRSFEKGIYNIYQKKVQDLKVDEGNIEKLNLVWKLIQAACLELAEAVQGFLDGKDIDRQLVSDFLTKFFLATEWSFRIPIKFKKNKEVLVGGRLDWLTIDPQTNEAIVWDFKTSPSMNFEIDIQQASIYAYAIKEKLGVRSKAALFYITISGIEKRIIEGEKLIEVQNLLVRNLERIYQWYSGEETPPATSDTDFCEWCQVADYCKAKYGANPYVPTMGEKWKELRDIRDRPKKKKRVRKQITPEKPIIKTLVEKIGANFSLGQNLSSKDLYEIHPMVFNKHAAILGASGSGKTVLGKKIIEEALFKGFSALMIDPQGDLCSIVLPTDKDSPYAKLINSIDWRIFTPGSEKGIKLSINPLETPSKEFLTDTDYRNALLDHTSSLLLLIIGFDLKKIPPEKALLESIILESWMKNEDLTFASLAKKVEICEEVRSITTGEVVTTESLISPQMKRKLARNLFKVAVGTEGAFFIGGESLHLNQLVENPSVFIVNLASVGPDITRRQLVVSWVLRLVYDWILTNPQQIQDQIRFFLYLDEIADFLPPHPFNPPSKKMLMLLFRQARKYGVSCIVATQSPASIDYKALDNVSTLFIGKVPTEQSRRKLQSYLEPHGDQIARKLMKISQKAHPGEFVVAGVGEPVHFKTELLKSKHLVLSLDSIAKLT